MNKDNNYYYALGISYLGSDYHGWQKQKNNIPTIEKYVELAISKVANQPIELTCAGRTDSGVHALGQVVSFSCSVDRDLSAWVRGVNRYLPNDIRIVWSKKVNSDFSARFSAQSRTYEYWLEEGEVRSAILNNQMAFHHIIPDSKHILSSPLNIKNMHQAAQYFLGEQDFSAFRSSECQANTPNRCVSEFIIKKFKNKICFRVTANAFLHHMVRNMVGSLIEVGLNKHSIDWIKEVLNSKNRQFAGPTAKPEGLYFIAAHYNPDDLKIEGIAPYIYK